MNYYKEIEKLTEKIELHDVISFDLFDTLLLRNVIEPTDIFRVVEKEYNFKYNVNLNFHKIRVRSERLARENSSKEDITLDDIYKYVQKSVGSISNELKRLELDTEQNFIVPNAEIKKMVEYAMSLEKKVYFITDMYLPSSFIVNVLNRIGITHNFKLFVSGELNVSKATGNMYKYILYEEKLNNETKWLHIGDNFISDVKNAEKYNITAHYYKKLSEREKEVPINSLGDSIVRALQINHKYANLSHDYWYQFGIEVVSALYLGVMCWLVEQLKGKDNIYFLSRDGYFPFQLYQIMLQFDESLPMAKYLYTSRRAYIYPLLAVKNKEKAIELFIKTNSHFGQKLTVRDLLINLGLVAEKYSSLLMSSGVETLDVDINENNKENVILFLERIWDNIEKEMQEELQTLEAYLQHEGLHKYDEINIFDIGWGGSVQYALSRILNKKVNGYYFGTLENFQSEVKDTARGYAFHQGVPFRRRNFIIPNAMMYEFVFSAPEGSLIRMIRNDSGYFQPELAKVELNDYVYSCMMKFQEASTRIFTESMRYRKYLDTLSKEFVLFGMEDLISSYRVTDMLQFAKLTNSVGIGLTKHIQHYVNIVHIHEYLVRPKYFVDLADSNLWNNALLILDEQGRYFNTYEANKLYGSTRFKFGSISKVIQILKKVARNPHKAWSRIKIMAKNSILRGES